MRQIIDEYLQGGTSTREGDGDAAFKHTTSTTKKYMDYASLKHTKINTRENMGFVVNRPGCHRNVTGTISTGTHPVMDARITKYSQCRTRCTISSEDCTRHYCSTLHPPY